MRTVTTVSMKPYLFVAFLLGSVGLYLLLPPPVAFGESKLAIHTEKGEYRFRVELAVTDEQRRRGLAGRESLSEGRGMLFLFRPARRVAMWMKDTLIPLDILFIRSGEVVGVARSRKPGSLERIASPGPVDAVLELKGGTVERLDIITGSKVTGLPQQLDQ